MPFSDHIEGVEPECGVGGASVAENTGVLPEAEIETAAGVDACIGDGTDGDEAGGGCPGPSPRQEANGRISTRVEGASVGTWCQTSNSKGAHRLQDCAPQRERAPFFVGGTTTQGPPLSR